jgi:hypothetical protein
MFSKPTLGALLNRRYRQHPRYRGCIGHWMMLEGGGATVFDLSVYGNPGVISGSVTWGKGRFGPALSYNAGGTGVVTAGAGAVTTFDMLTETTFAAWVYPTSIGAEEAVIYKVLAGGTPGKGLYLTTTNAFGYFVDRASGGDATALSANNTMTLNEWQFIAAVYLFGAAPRLFRNGSEVAYASQGAGTNALVSEETGGVTIGNREVSLVQFDGLIDDVRVYNRALTPSEVMSLYQDPFLEFKQRRHFLSVPQEQERGYDIMYRLSRI